MKKMPTEARVATRPGAAERWIRRPAPDTPAAAPFSARLTIDVTPAMRQRLKLAAVTRGTTVADLMRALVDAHFPDTSEKPT